MVAGLAYYYASTQNQINILRHDGRSFCLTVATEAASWSASVDNITETMQQNVQNNLRLIATLNSTRPAGYQGMVSVLNSENNQDLAIVSRISPSTASVGQVEVAPGPNFCTEVNRP